MAKKKNKKKNKKANNPSEGAVEGEKKIENGDTDKKIENGDTSDIIENGEVDDKSKKKRNRPKKKKADEPQATSGVKVQTDPPSVPISELFTGTYPVGQEMEYPVTQDDLKAKDRFSSEEARALDRAQLDMYNEIRQVTDG